MSAWIPRVAAVALGWCALRDLLSVISLALVVPFAGHPVAWVIVLGRLPVALAAAWGLAAQRRAGLVLAFAYLFFTAVLMVAWALATDPIAVAWGGAVVSWPVLGLLGWHTRRHPTAWR